MKKGQPPATPLVPEPAIPASPQTGSGNYEMCDDHTKQGKGYAPPEGVHAVECHNPDGSDIMMTIGIIPLG